VLLAAAVLVTGAVTGCGEDKKPAAEPIRRTKRATPAAAAIVPDAADTSSAPTYIYTPVGKRDPFRSFYKVEKKEKEKGPGGILTKFEIDQLKLTAIVSGISRPRAQVELPDGRGVNIRVGTRIGKNYGRVVRIRNDEVIVAEDYRDWSGRKVTNYIHMKIEKEKTR
jgi:type IV pilus assembly protein PilP